MGFSVDKLRKKLGSVTVVFQGEKLTVEYYAGEKAKELERRLARNVVNAQNDASQDAYADQMGVTASEETPEFDRGRRELCETLSMMIHGWDMTMENLGDLLDLVEELEEERDVDVEEEERAERRRKFDGQGGRVPIEAIWIDALPLPTAFHLKISNTIGNDMAVGGRAGKNN